MKTEDTTSHQMSEALDIIHDIAAKAGTVEGTPVEVSDALDKIVSLSRYKFNVINSKELKDK